MRPRKHLIACLAVLPLVFGACGGDDDGGGDADINGDLTPKELAAMLPDGGMPQAIAVDVVAAREAAGFSEDADPTALAGNDPAEVRFVFGAFAGLRDVAILTDNPTRTALDHGQIKSYAAHIYLADGAITLVETSQPFDELADALEAEGFERDGNTLTLDADPEEEAYTAIAPGDGYLVLGYDAETVESVASGDAEPSETGELEALEPLEGVAVSSFIPEDSELDCVSSVTTVDAIDGNSEIMVNLEDGTADPAQFPESADRDAMGTGFKITGTKADGATLTISLESLDQGLTNSPLLLVAFLLDEERDLIYDCA